MTMISLSAERQEQIVTGKASVHNRGGPLDTLRTLATSMQETTNHNHRCGDITTSVQASKRTPANCHQAPPSGLSAASQDTRREAVPTGPQRCGRTSTRRMQALLKHGEDTVHATFQKALVRF